MLYFLFCALFCVSAANEIDSRTCFANETYVQNYNIRIISHGCVQHELVAVENIEDFTYCCDRHTACYQTCGITKPFCDEDLKMCMHKVCQAILGNSYNCEANAESFHTSIVSSDFDVFHRMQTEYCTCHLTEEIEHYYVGAVRDFYSKYAPDMIDNAEKAVKMYKTKNVYTQMAPTYAYAKLYYDLHKKYDIGIGLSPRRKEIEQFPDPNQLWKRML